MKTLITAWEVIKKSPASDKTAPTNVINHIALEEVSFARECLGVDLYNALLDDVCEYDCLEEWSSLSTYAEGAFVTYYGSILESQVDNNILNPCEDCDSWKEAPKFKSACYEELWNNHLGFYLAFRIMKTALVFSTYQTSSSGVQETFSEDKGIKSASKGTFGVVVSAYDAGIQKHLDNLKFYVECNKTCGSFSTALFLQNCGDVCSSKKRSRRNHFMH